MRAVGIAEEHHVRSVLVTVRLEYGRARLHERSDVTEDRVLRARLEIASLQVHFEKARA